MSEPELSFCKTPELQKLAASHPENKIVICCRDDMKFVFVLQIPVALAEYGLRLKVNQNSGMAFDSLANCVGVAMILFGTNYLHFDLACWPIET